MAWTNVKDECLPRVARVARLLGVSDREVLGTLTLLWRNSQDRLAVEGTRENLVDWMHLEGEDAATIDRWFAALERAPFISRIPAQPFADPRWRIHGNEVEVHRAEDRAEKARKGAKKRWAKAESMPEACSEHAPSMPEATPMQGKAMHCKEEEGAAASRPPSSPPPPEKISKPDPIQTEADTTVLDPDDPPRLVGDPELNDWLVGEMRASRRGFNSWLKSHAGGDVVRLETMLRAAEAKWVNDERIAQRKALQGAPPTQWLNTFLEIEAKKYVSAPAPPPGGAAIVSLPAPKAETQDEYLARRKREAEAEKAAELTPEQRREILRRYRPSEKLCEGGSS